MSRRSHPEDDEATLFDLPLHRSGSSTREEDTDRQPTESPPTPPAPAAEPPAAPPVLPAESPAAPPWERPSVAESPPQPTPTAAEEPFGPLPDPPDAELEAPNISFAMTLPFDGEAAAEESGEAVPAKQPGEPMPASFGSLLLAGMVDFGLIFAGMVAAVLGAAALGAPPGPADAPALVGLALTFSFPYFVVPLAFWGRTAGMAAVSLFARSHDGRPLSFRQAMLRWIAALITVATAGLPLLIALRGRSLADHLSGSHTLSRH